VAVGLLIAASIPLIAQFGAGVMLVVTSVLLVVWLAVGLLVFGRRDRTPHPQRAGG
jgi:ESS family glutamate:Na+ symporter